MSFKKNTAVTGFPFVMLSAATGVATAGLTVTGRILKDGGAQATIAGTVVDEGNGQYSVNLTASEMNATLVGLLFTATGAVPAAFTIKTVSVDPDDAVRGGMSALPNASPGGFGGLATVDGNNYVGGVIGDVRGDLQGKILGSGISSFTGVGVAAVADVAGEYTIARQENLSAAQSDLATILDQTGASGVVVAAGSKTGYALAASGLDAISATPVAGPATTFPQMLVQLWRRFFCKSTLTSSQLKTYANDGATVLTTQSVADDAHTQTQGPAA